MEFIWYNPDKQTYEIGSNKSYELQRKQSKNPSGFTLLYKMNATSKPLGNKLIKELNKARTEQPTRFSVHAA